MGDRMRGIVPDDILDALKKKKLGLPGIDIEVQEDRNAMQMGEFEVIKELLAAFPEAKIAKAQVDKLIDHSGLRTMIEEGRGKLEWERKIPDEKLSELKDMLSCADFKANMPKVIKRIYELSWDMFGDLPRGHHKDNSMHKLASKTMIEILPENLANHVEKKCGSLAGTPDFFDVIGQVSWYEPEA